MKDVYLKVGELRKKLEGLPDDMPIFYQRIEDFYFKENHWTTKTMLEYSIPQAFSLNGDIRYESEYIRAFDCHKAPEDYAFIINAHY